MKVKNESGITLIALVVTIVVLIILASITINIVSGDNGLVQKAKDAQAAQVVAQEKEKVQLAYGASILNNDASEIGKISKEDLENELKNDNVTVTQSSSGSEDVFTILFNNTEHTYYLTGKGSIQQDGEIEEIELTNDMAETYLNYDKNSTDDLVVPSELVIDGKLCKVVGLEKYLFSNSNANTITVSEGIRYLKNNFISCSNVSTINLPSTLISIDKENMYSPSCYHCNSLENINFDKNNPNWTTVDGVVYSKDMKTLIVYPSGKTDESFKVPDSVEIIGANAFDVNHWCVNNDKDYLKQVTLSKNIKTLKYGAFRNRINLNRIYMDNNKKVTEIQGDIFMDCSSLLSVNFLDDSIKKINGHAFDGCSKLSSVILPSDLERIETSAFQNCLIKSIELPENLNYIGAYSFSENPIDNITIPGKVNKIGDRVLEYTKAKVNFENYQTITEVGDSAFYTCTCDDDNAVNYINGINANAFSFISCGSAGGYFPYYTWDSTVESKYVY